MEATRTRVVLICMRNVVHHANLPAAKTLRTEDGKDGHLTQGYNYNC